MSTTSGLLKTSQNPQTAVIRAATVLKFYISKTKFITTECPQHIQQPSTQFSQKAMELHTTRNLDKKAYRQSK
jgi:hypothetical protein